ncbi:SRPBCC family protein [Specibacter cremeus]|uniref:SRPBCC family protein n=1 Tax=Specibacter cremeus TaxID=1629051 RepID=UPI000F782C36|nr:SRPBCC family protein [Specibacter cremeus]
MNTRNAVVITAEPGTPFATITREVDAPPADVYRAYTEPDLLVQWLGPRGLVMELGDYDVRPGGKWSYTHRDPSGMAFGFRGVFHSVTPGEQLVQTFEFDGAAGHVCLERVDLADLGGRTRITVFDVFQSVEDRDAMLASGMEDGLTDSYERMEELLGVAAQ